MANRRRQTQTPKGQQQQQREWDFFSFPSFAAFSLGMFLVLFILYVDLGGQFVDAVHLLLWFISLIGVTFSATHVISRQIMRRRAQSRLTRADEEESERRVLAARARAAAEAAEGGEGAAPRRRRRRRS